RHRRRRGSLRRGAVHDRQPVPDGRNFLHRRCAGHRALNQDDPMNMFDRLDASLRLSEDEQMLVDSVTTMTRERIAPRAEGFDRSGEFPWENVRDINALGLNAMFVPEEYGGAP